MDGGGACYDQTTCNTTPPSNGFSVARIKYDAGDFLYDQTLNTGDINAGLPFNWSKPELGRGIFDRTNNGLLGITNPFINVERTPRPHVGRRFRLGRSAGRQRSLQLSDHHDGHPSCTCTKR